MRTFGAAGDTELTDKLSVISMYKADVADALKKAQAAATLAGSSALADLAVTEEAIRNWLSFEASLNTRSTTEQDFTRWKSEGERLIGELLALAKRASGAGAGIGVAVAALVVVGLAFWANRG
jgi:hypothetical protein